MAPILADSITFGERDGNFLSTRVDGGSVCFTIGNLEEPLRAPFGVSEPLNGNSDRKTLDLEVDGETTAGRLKAIDAAVVAEAIKRPYEFFGKRLDEASVRAMHIPLVTAKEGYTPTVRTKVKLGNGKCQPTMVRVITGPGKFKRGTLDDVTRNSKVMVRVALSSVWFASKMFGVSLSVDEVMVCAPPPEPLGIEAFGLTGFTEEEKTEE